MLKQPNFFFRKTTQKILLYFLLFLSVFSIVQSTIGPSTALAESPYHNQLAADNEGGGKENPDENNGCDVGFIGWIFCAISYTLSKLADGIFAVLTTLLHIEPLSKETEGGKVLYRIWSSFRSVANIIFILLFLVIIWSHLTSTGLSNYDIKRTLPRLVVNIILVNTSYYIGLIIVDLANILGISLKTVLDSIANSITYHPEIRGWGNIITFTLAGVGGGAALVAVIYIFAASLMPLVVSAVILTLTVVLILVARQAIIITLIIISPIAFALNVLPNTQKWFSKWWNILITTSMIYPIIAIIAGGGTVVANIIRSAAGNTGGMPNMILAILGMAAEALPLIMIPNVIKSSSGALSSIANAASKISNGSLSPLRERAKLQAENINYQRRANNLGKRNLMGTYASMMALGKNKRRELDEDLSPGNEETGYTKMDEFLNKNAESIADNATKDIKDPNKREQKKKEIKDSIEKKIIQLAIVDIDAEEAIGELEGKTTDDWTNDLDSSDENIRAAAYRKIGRTKDNSLIEDALNKLAQKNGDTTLERAMLANGIDESGAGDESAHLGKASTDAIRNGSVSSIDGLFRSAAEAGKYTPSQLAKENKNNIRKLGSIMPSLSQSAQSNIRSSKDSIDRSDSLKSKMNPAAYRALGNI